MKQVLITGVAGQDGVHLSEHLLESDYNVVGIDINKPLSTTNVEVITDVDISDTDSVFKLIKEIAPDEIYHLAAYHKSSQDSVDNDLDTFKISHAVNVLAVANFLEAIRLFSKSTKLFYASSSQIFGKPDNAMQDEDTTLNPTNIYGITKSAATQLCRYYRTNYNVFASVGIMYAHESPLRTSNFVSKKIVETAVAIKMGHGEKLVLGHLGAEADWGYAGDYVVAMHKILQHHVPDDFVISSGVRHTVQDFVQTTFDYLGLNWEKYVVEDKSIVKSISNFSVLGNNHKLVSLTGWNQTVDFEGLVKLLVEAELSIQKNE
ncbi:NAD-dependent epimerase/dehydratase family protein [Candidatus Marinimicrobia bacterium MT.SAG.2]|nr:NAD-dependent epimerase/dehydratase family protein [Candidatus Marinimicrobia bacterium MT.SAG.2]